MTMMILRIKYCDYFEDYGSTDSLFADIQEDKVLFDGGTLS